MALYDFLNIIWFFYLFCYKVTRELSKNQ